MTWCKNKKARLRSSKWKNDGFQMVALVFEFCCSWWRENSTFTFSHQELIHSKIFKQNKTSCLDSFLKRGFFWEHFISSDSYGPSLDCLFRMLMYVYFNRKLDRTILPLLWFFYFLSIPPRIGILQNTSVSLSKEDHFRES